MPFAAGDFGLDDQIATIIDFLSVWGADGTPVHLVAVCQPGVAALTATARMAEDNAAARPASLTLIGSPIDGRVNPQMPNRVASRRSFASFERDMIYSVPFGAIGAGRRVYPGWLQHQAFLWMKPRYHFDKHLGQLRSAWRSDTEALAQHDAFYAEFHAVMDLPATFYLDTIDRVFQRHLLARGCATFQGRPVRPDAIVDIPLLTGEGANDDITGPGQTRAAHALVAALPSRQKFAWLQPDVGHFGLFSGSRWRQGVLPQLASFIAAHPSR
mgnify:CR=1 FL=1